MRILGVRQGGNNMKKLFATLFLALAGTLVLSGCSLSGEKTVIRSEEDVFNYALLSAADLISQTPNQATFSIMETETPVEEPVTEEPVTDEPVAETPAEETDEVLARYLQLVETYLSNDAITAEATTSDRPEFETMLVYTSKDMLGGTRTFVVYFNQVDTEEPVAEEPVTEEPVTEEPVTEEPVAEEPVTEEPVAEEPETEEPNDDFEEAENEVEYELTGLIVIDGVEYELVGRKEIEDGEEEYKFIAYIDQDNFIRISYESDEEDGEQKFRFTQVSDGVLVYETKIKLEVEDNEFKVMLTYKTEDSYSKFMFKESDEASFDIMVKYEIIEDGQLVESGHAKIYIMINEETGETTYEYDVLGSRSGREHEHHNGFDRPERDHDDDDDDNRGNGRG